MAAERMEPQTANDDRQQAVVAELSQLALRGAPLAQLIGETAGLAANGLGASMGAVFELSADGQVLLLRAGSGWQSEADGQAIISALDQPTADISLLTEAPLSIPDLRQERRFKFSWLFDENGAVSGISAPIPGPEGPFGVLGVYTRQPRSFTREDECFLQNAANLLGVALRRNRSEAALRISREQLDVILRGVADGVTIQDEKGRLVYANRAVVRFLGYKSVQEAMAAPPMELRQRFTIWDEGGKPFPLDQIQKDLIHKNQPALPVTARVRLQATGRERWVLFKIRPINDANGKLQSIVTIYEDVTDIKRAERTHQLLTRAGELLASSTDYQARLNGLAQLLVPQLADWCAIFINNEESDTPGDLVVAHVDPGKASLVSELHQRWPSGWDTLTGAPQVRQTAQPAYQAEIEAEKMMAHLPDPACLAVVRQLGAKSTIVLPLVARDRRLGMITLAWAESNRRYSPADLLLAEELAHRAALAIDNARLYQEAQALNAELEQRVALRTSQLKSTVAILKNEIAERKWAEEALRKNEAVLQSFFEGSPDATVIVDEQGRIVRINTQVEAIFGYSREKLIGQPVERLLPDQHHQNHLVYRSSYADSPALRPMGAGLNLYGRQKDGTEFPVDVMLSPLQTEEGTFVIAAIRDITERKRAEAALRERDELLRAAVTGAPITLFVIDRQGILKLCMGQAITGLWPLPRLVGQAIESVSAQLPGLQEGIRRALAGETFTTSAQKDGQSFDIQYVPLHDDKRNVSGVIGVAIDITARKEMEAELAELQRRLIEGIENERLYLSQELHDGPIQDLHSASYLLQAMKDGQNGDHQDPTREVNDTLLGVIHSLRVICQELRPPTLAPFGLEKAIRSHAEYFHKEHPELEIRLKLMADGQLLSERVRLTLFRIYQQALNNVARHAQADQIDISLQLDAEQVILEVQDNGRGFQVPERWIEMARQGHLGLVGAAERAEAIAGRLAIESQPGRGTIIRVSVPLQSGGN
jgi:PAS domain S-box-containing protein